MHNSLLLMCLIECKDKITIHINEGLHYFSSTIPDVYENAPCGFSYPSFDPNDWFLAN